jgi:hypothetical protein
VVPAQAEAAQLRPHLLRLHARLRAAAPGPVKAASTTRQTSLSVSHDAEL